MSRPGTTVGSIEKTVQLSKVISTRVPLSTGSGRQDLEGWLHAVRYLQSSYLLTQHKVLSERERQDMTRKIFEKEQQYEKAHQEHTIQTKRSQLLHLLALTIQHQASLQQEGPLDRFETDLEDLSPEALEAILWHYQLAQAALSQTF